MPLASIWFGAKKGKNGVGAEALERTNYIGVCVCVCVCVLRRHRDSCAVRVALLFRTVRPIVHHMSCVKESERTTVVELDYAPTALPLVGRNRVPHLLLIAESLVKIFSWCRAAWGSW